MAMAGVNLPLARVGQEHVLDNTFARFNISYGGVAKDWFVGWTDLTEASPSEKIERAGKMASINQSLRDEPAFTAGEIREEAGYDPATQPPPISGGIDIED